MNNSKCSPDFIKPKKKSLPVNTLFSLTVLLFACVKLVLSRNLQALVPFLIYLVLCKCYVSSIRLY